MVSLKVKRWDFIITGSFLTKADISQCIPYRDDVTDFTDADSDSDTELPSIEEILSAVEHPKDATSPDTSEDRHNSTVEFGRSGRNRGGCSCNDNGPAWLMARR